MIIHGKCSIFGGYKDRTMLNDSGLALYEPMEANNRPDLFYSSPDWWPTMETWKRLRTDSFYIALRFDSTIARKINQSQPWKVTNPKNGKSAKAYLVDWGPNQKTGKDIDLSPGLADFLGVITGDEVIA